MAERDYKWALFALAGLAVPAGLWLSRYDPGAALDEAEARRGWKKTVDVPAPYAPPLDASGALAFGPRFPKGELKITAMTAAVDATRAIDVRVGDREIAMKRPVRFDRKTESASLLFYWRSEELADDEVKRFTATLEGAAVALKDYLDPLDKESKPAIYYQVCADCDSDEQAGGAAGRHAITLALPKEEMLETAVHELAHFYTSGRSGCSARPALCEGIAVFADAAFSGKLGRVHGVAKRSREPRAASSVFELTHHEFFFKDGLYERYMLGGSFVAFAAERHGIRPVLAELSGVPFPKAYGRPRSQAEAEWKAFLQSF